MELWRLKKGNLMCSNGKSKGKEVVLGAVESKNSGGCKCFVCGSDKHLKANYPKRGGKGGNPNADKKCYLCGKMGHIKKDCWELEANAAKHPAG